MTRPSWFFRLQSLGTCMLMLLHDAERVRAESGLPSLSYRLVELSALELSWTSSDERIVLETSGTIDDCIPWRSLPGTQLHVGDTHSVTVPISDNPAFFQLYRLPETNLPPRLCSVGSRTVTVGERLTFDVAAVDPNRSPIRFSASPLPPNSHFDAETGRFTFQPTPTELGVHAVTFGVTDGTSTDEETVGITVKPLALRFDLLDDGNLRLSWTNNPRGFVLEQSTVIDGSNAWSLATSSVTQSANRNLVDVRPSEANRFFRLRLQRVPPLFKPMPSSYALALGTDIRLDLEASDADGDTLTFASDDLSLPDGAKLDGLTGTFTWRPNPSQIGTNVLRFIVSDGLHVERQTVSVVVRDAPPDGITRLTGRILDTTDAVAGRERPVVGARVSLLRNTAFALSDANGRFVLSDIPSGKQVLDIDTSAASPAPDNSPYAAFREEIQLIPRTDNVVGRPFYLPRIDPSSLTMVNPEAVTTVRNTNLNVTLTIPAHSAKMNGKDYDGPITISLVPSALAPAALPEFLQPNVLITIQPVGVTYAVPAAISFPNTTGIKPGNRANIWSLDAGTGQFTVVGLAEPAGDSLRTIAGGIRANDWHTAMPVSCAANNDPQLHATGSQCPTCPLSARTGSSTALASGLLTTDFSLPHYISMNEARSLRFVYNSLSAYPYHLISYGLTIPAIASIPGRISASLFLEDTLTGNLVSATTALEEDHDERLTSVMPASLWWLPTGSYRYTLRFCNLESIGGALPGASGAQLHSAPTRNFAPAQSICSYSRGVLDHLNGVHDNLFGVGWGIADLQRLHLQPNHDVLLSYGDGALARFQARGAKPFTVGVWNRVYAGPGLGLSFGPNEAYSKAYRSLTNNYPRASIKTFDTLTAESLAGVDLLLLTDVNFVGHPAIRALDPAEQQELRAFVEAGGGAFLLPGLEPSLSLVAPFHVRAGSDPQSSTGLGEQRIPILSPEFSPVTSGPHGSVFDVSKNRDLFMTAFDEEVKSLTLKPVSFLGYRVGTDLAVVPRHQLRPGSGPVVILTDPTALADVKESGGDPFVLPSDLFDRNETLFLNIVDYCIERIPEPSAPDLYRSPRGDFTRLSRNEDNGFTRSYEDGSVLRFDARGLQTEASDRHGNTTRFEYDAQGRLSRVTDPVGLVTQLRYAESLLSEVIDPTGRRTAFAYDPQRNLARVTFPDRSTLGYGYDQWHLLTTETNALGYVSTHRFDAYGRMIGAERPDGSRQIISPGLRQVVGNPSPTLGTLDSPLPPVRAEAVLSSLTEVLGTNQFLQTSFRTGVFGEATETYDPAGLRTRTTRDSLGQPTTVVPPSGHTLHQEFDNRARLIRSSDPLFGATNSIRYESRFFEVATVTDALGNTTTNAYDEKGNLTLSVSPMGRTTTAGYNSAGQPTALTNSLGLVTRLAYDARGNVAELAVGAGVDFRGVTNRYTPEGFLESITDPLGQTTSLAYDAVGRATNQVFADGTFVRMTYDAAGQVASITPPGKPAHTFQYTPTGLLAEYAAPDLGDGKNKTRYEYNAAQQLTRVLRPDGLNVDYGYDPAGRLTTITNSRGATTFEYDATTGLLVTNTSPDGVTLSYKYQGELATNIVWSGAVTGTLSRTYDPNYRVRSSQVNDGPVITYDYDKDGLVTRAGDLHIARDPRTGLEIATTNGLVTTRTAYDAFGQVTNYVAMTNGNPIFVVDYQRDRLGRIVEKHEVIQGETNQFSYRYDAVGRLTNTVSSWNSAAPQSVSYRYDANGNRTHVEGPDGTITAEYDAQDRLLSRSGPRLNEAYQYSDTGELLSITKNNETTTFRYDSNGNLIELNLPNGDRIDYAIDGNNRRMAKSRNGHIQRQYLYSGQLQVAAELDSQSQTLCSFVYAQNEGVPVSFRRNDVEYRVIGPDLGSPRLVVDISTGEVIQELSYDTWGSIVRDSMPGFQPFGFAAGLADESNLLHFGAREYDVSIGRWTSKDPISIQPNQANLFSYAGSDPINFVDRSGLFEQAVHDGKNSGGLIGGWLGALLTDAAKVTVAPKPNALPVVGATAVTPLIGAAVVAAAGTIGGFVGTQVGLLFASSSGKCRDARDRLFIGATVGAVTGGVVALVAAAVILSFFGLPFAAPLLIGSAVAGAFGGFSGVLSDPTRPVYDSNTGHFVSPEGAK